MSFPAPAAFENCDGRRRAKERVGERGSFYLYMVVAARIYLLRCYAKNAQTDLSADEKKQLRQLAAHLKGAH